MNRRSVLKAGLGAIIAGPFLMEGERKAAEARAAGSKESVHWTEASNVVWTTPSQDAAGSMPLGNGEVGINLWVEAGGDLLFYLSRSDSFSEIGRLLKVGQMRLSLSPNPFAAGMLFRQMLRLRDGVCEITAGAGAHKVTLSVFVDSEQPVVHCVGKSASPIHVTARVESWRTEAHTLADGGELSSAWHMMGGAPFPLTESADVFSRVSGNTATWYHRNELSPAFTSSLQVQSLETAASTVHDPLLHRTFGGWLTGDGLTATDRRSLKTPAPVHSFAVRVAAPCLQTSSAQEWLDAAQKAAAASSLTMAAKRTAAWWQAYWNRSWVTVHGDRGMTIPGNAYPLRVGYDSNHENTFPGELGRVGVYKRSLSAAEIARVAGAGREQPAPIQTELEYSGEGTSHEIADAALDFHLGFTLEAWIKTDGTREGRIFDKLTAGQDDGFLLDLSPKDTLRFIVGSRHLQTSAGLISAGSWQHVAATVDADSGAVRLYVGGKQVAEWPGESVHSPVTRGYTLQRYIQACGGRGQYPIKFNGGIYTVEPKALGKPFNADWRQWGETHWFQNVRHMYHPMLAGGDFEMMDAFFRLYENARPLAEARTRLYHGAEGCYFPETMTVWGTYANSDYGWDRSGKQPKEVNSPWWRYAWNQGPELVALLLDRWDYTEDRAFLQTHVLPMAVSVLTYFDTRFSKDAAGRIVLDPTQAVETLWTGVINDMPSTAGLTAITTRLCALPAALTTPEQRRFFEKMQAAAPILPLEYIEENGEKHRTLAPAQKYDPKRSNCENPELYAVWPFRLYTQGKPDLETARTAYRQRVNHLDVGWGYDGSCAALLGLADEAARILQVKCANSHPAYRWPATWGPNFDWLPDQNHGGNLLETTHLMLLQSEGEHLFLLPAWPKHWDVSFRLHAPRQTVVECVFRAGNVERLIVTPQLRAKDIVLPA